MKTHAFIRLRTLSRTVIIGFLMLATSGAPARVCRAACEAPMLMGGYMNTEVGAAGGGAVQWMGFYQNDGFPGFLPLHFEGIYTGAEVPNMSVNGDIATYMFRLDVPGGAPAGAYLLTVGSSNPAAWSSSHWPYLTVLPGEELVPPADEVEFENVAIKRRLRDYGYNSGRIAFYDIDGDGWLDVVMNRTKVLLNRPAPDGGREFIDFTAEAGLEVTNTTGDARVPTTNVFADIDNDGDVDCYSAMYLDFKARDNPTPDLGFRSGIFLNDGTGRFTLLEDSGVEDNPGTEVPAGFVDYDNDGCLDIAVGYFYENYGYSYNCYPNRVYKGNCDGTFTDMTGRIGLNTSSSPSAQHSRRPTYGLTHADWNNDGWQDIFFAAYGRQRNYHYANDGAGNFTEIGEKTHVAGDDDQSDDSEYWFRQNGNTFAIQPADYNNDGSMDLICSEITHSWAGSASDKTQILTNLGPDQNWTFRREFRGSDRPLPLINWNQGDIHAGWMDFDLDGWQDLLIASGDYPDGQYLRLFQQGSFGPNGEHNWFRDVTDLADFNWESSAAISVGDYNRDGKPDLIAGRSLMRMPTEKRLAWGTHGALFENHSGRGRGWVTVRLEGKGRGFSNRQGIGARVYVTAGGITQMQDILGAAGHAGQMNAKEAYFGLGPHCRIDELRIRWPNSTQSEQVFTGVPANKVFVIREGEDVLHEWGR